MNESIKFINDDPLYGKYATDDTGTMIAVVRNYNDAVVGVIRLDDNSYVTAPLSDIEYVAAES